MRIEPWLVFSNISGEVDLKQEIITANKRLHDEMVKHNINFSFKHELWSTCAIVVSIVSDHINYAYVGDCELIMVDHQGEITVLTEGSSLEEGQGQDMVLPDEKVFEHLSEEYKQLAYRRYKANYAGGYGIANGMEEMKNWVRGGRIDQASVRYLLLVSDGMLHERRELPDVTLKVIDLGVEQYAIELEQYELNHRLYTDDKTGILLKWHK